VDVATQSLWWFRRIFIDKASVDEIVEGLRSEVFDYLNRYDQLLSGFFTTVPDFLESCSTVDRFKMVTKCMAIGNAEALCRFLVAATFGSFSTMYSIWKSLDEGVKICYLGKLRVSVPHWRMEDRSYFLASIRTKGKTCKGSYVGELLKEVKMQRFKEIVFGKEKFCAHCHRSSYIGNGRLWCCRRCVEEHVRPKARYCNVKCQKAHWPQHRYEAHGGKKPDEKKTSAPAQSTEGKKLKKHKKRNKKSKKH